MIRRLYLVRHGPTHQRAFTGWRDVPADLSDTDQIARLAAALPEVPVVSSDLIRAVVTADAITGRRIRLPHERDLREFDFGAWDGLEFPAVSARDPDLSRRFWEHPGDVAAPGGESWNAVTARVGATLDRLLDQTEGGELIVVAHFGAILCHLARATGLSAEAALGYRIDPLSLTVLAEAAPEAPWTAERINHIP